MGALHGVWGADVPPLHGGTLGLDIPISLVPPLLECCPWAQSSTKSHGAGSGSCHGAAVMSTAAPQERHRWAG